MNYDLIIIGAGPGGTLYEYISKMQVLERPTITPLFEENSILHT